MDVGKTPSQELEPVLSSPDIKRKTENNDTNEDDKTHIVHIDNDSSGSMDPHQKLKKKKKTKKSGKEESKEKIEDQTPQNGSQDDSHVALEESQTEKVTAIPEANHKDSKEDDEEFLDDSLSNSSLGMRMKDHDETELEKKKWEEKRVKAIKEEDVVETDSDHSKDERPIMGSDEKKVDSDDDKVLRKSNSELNENSSPPTPLMVEILSMSHHSDSSDDESEAESSSTTPGSTPKSEKKKRPTLLSEPEFNENFILDTLLTIRTSTLGAMKRPWEEITEKDFHSSIHYKISRTGSQKRFL